MTSYIDGSPYKTPQTTHKRSQGACLAHTLQHDNTNNEAEIYEQQKGIQNKVAQKTNRLPSILKRSIIAGPYHTSLAI
ncbi:hypothetical protein MTR_4g036045 [Medicago truncatula]|uniref:Uncharacterized protein n=1 Tax=Medicago truncatula TaxID=3880 RepID=A0A072UU52_MEDTR|nr:hypothetical protein MTR_4g036045 [Medicago truncatula]